MDYEEEIVMCVILTWYSVKDKTIYKYIWLKKFGNRTRYYKQEYVR